MAFWGVEVKPGKPFTHEYDDLKGRLHISMATLGFGPATGKSMLQCNVGNRSPVYLCSLYPGTTESLQLNLELEEVEHVIFSVIGPRSIHLTGYYLARGTGQNANINDESESYGEDIADTETEGSDEDEYDDSFIDDDCDLEVFPPSPISSQEEGSHNNRPNGKKSKHRRLRRKYQQVESDDDGVLKDKIFVYGCMDDQTKEIDSEDGLPISSLSKTKASGKVKDQEMDDSGDRIAGHANIKSDEDSGKVIVEANLKTDDVLVDSQTQREGELPDHSVDPCTVLDVEDIKNMKKKKKKKGKEKEPQISCNGHSINVDHNSVQDEPKMDKMTQDLLAGKEKNQEPVDNKETKIEDTILPSSEVGHGNNEKPKKKRKRSKNGVLLTANVDHNSDLANLSQRNEQQIVNETGNDGANSFPNGNQSEEKVKKKRKKSKSQGDAEVVNSEFAVSVEQTIKMEEDVHKRVDEEASQIRTLSNGLVIQELETGTQDGKIAMPGKKISVHYTCKLKENGEVFESNAGQAPFKFRLGKGQVMEGWNVGLEGMRVGGKRRLTIPPSMTEGHSTDIPTNSWLIYDFELVKVH